MADENNTISDAIARSNGIDASKQAEQKKGKKEVAGQEEFLTLLINQLQNQDPLDPMKSEEFAVQLAQFSQLEQLIQINDKIGGDEQGGAGGSVATMASFLGQQVTLKDQPVSISAGKGPDLMLNMPAGTSTARVDFLNDEGKVVGSKIVENLTGGRQSVALEEVNVPAGDYDVRAVAVTDTGKFINVDAAVTGVVEGFVLEPEAALLVNGQQVSMENVVEVSKPVTQASEPA